MINTAQPAMLPMTLAPEKIARKTQLAKNQSLAICQ